jgi:hypothetical protein
MVLLASTSVFAACGDESPAGPSTPEARPGFQAAGGENEVRAAEADFATLAHEVPGAGGFFFDEDGTLFVYLKDTGRADAAKQKALVLVRNAARLRGGAGRDPAVVVLAGQFDFFELNRARNRITDPVLAIAGVVFVDLDEATNRVTIGVSQPAARGRVEARLAELGVRRDIVDIEAAEEITAPMDEATLSEQSLYTVTVNGFFRPLVGGTQIGKRGSDPEKFRKCTMGFIGRLNDGTRAFITNSHCSSRSWDTDGSTFHQPYPSRYDDALRVGYEYRDKRGATCSYVYVCRGADATAIRIDDEIGDEAGYIVRTRYYSTDFSVPGSLEIDPANPRFRIAARGGVPFKGQQTDKIGATTGWTRGPVSETCADVKQPERSWSILRCQYATRAGVKKGDSGAPVFYDHGDGSVTLEGILFGSGGGQFWWSPFDGVERDLGRINIFPPYSGGGNGNELPPPPSDCTNDPAILC